MYRQQAIFCFGMFVTMFALISAIGQLNRPPFNWLSIDHVSISTAVVIWMIFIVTVVGVTRRAD